MKMQSAHERPSALAAAQACLVPAARERVFGLATARLTAESFLRRRRGASPPQVCAEYDVVSPCMGTGSDFPLPDGCTRPWLSAGAAR